MRVALLTEGLSEYSSLPALLPDLSAQTGHTILKPIKVQVHPDAQAAVIAKACKSSILLAAKVHRADRIVILLDREQQQQCPGRIASAIETAIGHVCPTTIPVFVVLKDRAYENWLIADLDALRAQPARFQVTASIAQRVEKGADRVDGTALMKSAIKGSPYDKVRDSQRITRKMTVAKAARHSRSFRHFLHVLDHVTYSTQCRVPG